MVDNWPLVIFWTRCDGWAFSYIKSSFQCTRSLLDHLLIGVANKVTACAQLKFVLPACMISIKLISFVQHLRLHSLLKGSLIPLTINLNYKPKFFAKSQRQINLPRRIWKDIKKIPILMILTFITKNGRIGSNFKVLDWTLILYFLHHLTLSFPFFFFFAYFDILPPQVVTVKTNHTFLKYI